MEFISIEESVSKPIQDQLTPEDRDEIDINGLLWLMFLCRYLLSVLRN
jgi:hypothetical protein